MKHQYFGDQNDFDKYLVLRLLRRHGLTLSVIWMLTPDDGSSDGRKLGYLDRGFWRSRDPELFAWLLRWKREGASRHVGLIERSGLVDAEFSRESVPATPGAREGWLNDALSASRGADIMFFDPDNGLETAKLPRTTRLSTKHVYLNEVSRAWHEGHSVLVYQHHARVTVPTMIDRCRHRAAEVIGEGRLYVVRTGGDSSFFLFCREEHFERAERPGAEICAGDAPRGFLRASLTSDEAFVAHRWTDPPWSNAESELGLVDPDPAALWRPTFSARSRSGPLQPLTTRIGCINRSGQEVIRRTDLPGSDHRQRVYVLRCHSCNLEYGANGSDVWVRKCPGCQGGKAGLAFE